MNNKEVDLFFYLCNHIDTDKESLRKLAAENSTPEVLGQLFFNRMHGIAYETLKNTGILPSVNREFRNSLSNAYQINVEKNRSFFCCIHMLDDILKGHRDKYAMLKGAYLCAAYPDGCRTSNDIDLLVNPKNITVIGEILNKYGFKQGYIANDEFVPASRREIIESRIMRGETIPYILEVELPYMRYLEVDINFSLDYKNSDHETIDRMLSRVRHISIKDNMINTLDVSDFIIHLCCHLYKEATTYPWVKMRRDMTLYKYYDIYIILKDITHDDFCAFLKRAEELQLYDVCICVLKWVSELFGFDFISKNDIQITDNIEVLVNQVIDPAGKKIYTYTETDIRKRFFANNRDKLLEEVAYE